MLAAEEFLCGSGAACPAAPSPAASSARRWLRPLLQWSGVVLAHAAVLGLVLQISPQARQVLGEVIIQASLIAPQALPVAPPEPSPPPPKPPRPQKPVTRTPPPPTPLLSVAPRAEAAAEAFVAPPPPAEPLPAAPAAPALPALIPPVFNADYLDNPAPQYPPMSRRRGETGRVLLRVYVSADGLAERVELRASSGFERLDAAAREAVARWRFVPARRGDEKVAAWVLVPISFVM